MPVPNTPPLPYQVGVGGVDLRSNAVTPLPIQPRAYANGVREFGEKFERRRAEWQNNIVTHFREFLVKNASPNDGTVVAMQAGPQPGEAWRGLPLTRLSVEPIPNTPYYFTILAEFSTPQGSTAATDDPLKRLPDVTWGFTDGTENYFTDNSNPPKKVVNSALQKFSNDLQREKGDMLITVVQNEATHDPVAADDYSHAVNTDDITIDGVTFPATVLKLSPITATKQSETITDPVTTLTRTVIYYRRTYVFKVRNPERWGENPWRDHVLDTGNEQLVQTTDPATNQVIKVARPIYDAKNGTVVDQNWPLDGSGNALPSQDSVPALLEFQPYVELPFAPLLIRNPPPPGSGS